MKISYNEFHVNKNVRNICNFNKTLFASSGNVIFSNMKEVRIFAEKLNSFFEKRGEEQNKISAGNLNAMGLIDEIFHYMCMLFRRQKDINAFKNLLDLLDNTFGKSEVDNLLLSFIEEFPPTEVYKNNISAKKFLEENAIDIGTNKMRSNREQTIEELILLQLANDNPAFKKFAILFDDSKLLKNNIYKKSFATIKKYFSTLPTFGPFNHDLITLLKEPVVFSPNSLKGQLDYIRTHWIDFLGEWLSKLLSSLDTISEEEKAAWQFNSSPEMVAYSYENLMKEYERFSSDSDWMPKVVLMAKTVLVWLDQLSKKYKREINRLDEIPDEELDLLRDEGFTGLWLIGLWQRSYASRRIKQINGNPEAAASAYSLYDYEIADNIGGWQSLENLRTRLWQRGIRLASDMVPNHTGMDSKWIVEKPNLFVQRKDCPFPQYTFSGENLSQDNRVGIYLEDHYYNQTDCAVLFKRVDNYTGDVRYIYHGNDGTGMAWNDTAQIDFLNPAAREEVMQEIIKVAKNFPIIRFDAAMVLAKKHIRRLWYPEPGHGGDIATRSETALSTKQFNEAIPNEFWREVVDRIAKEVPDTLLLAEAFWMMEGYFVRTLGMHRVYNSAFMNMLKKEENQKYRDTIKNTLQFDPQVLKRFVNFMNNPDEETAVMQFGKGDKYFGVCTLMVTMPGLPMFGHGQIEGFEEKYGMEYTKAYKDENPDEYLIARHWHDIFPLMKKRYLFSQVENFLFFDVWKDGVVNENIFAYSNNVCQECSLVFYNNKYESAYGWIKESVPYIIKTGNGENDKKLCTKSICDGLNLSAEENKYCILYEQHSNLWYIRKSKEICENGMFVSLQGFEAQVYTNILQVEDDETQKYKTLCESLNGKGCESFEVAFEEITYKELYIKLNNFLDLLVAQLQEVILVQTKDKITKTIITKKTKQLFDSVEDSAIDFYKCVNEFAQKQKIKLAIPERQFKLFKESANKIISIYADLYLYENKTISKISKIKTSYDFIKNILLKEKSFVTLAILFTSVFDISLCGLSKQFNIARKFSEYFKQHNISGELQTNNFLRMFTLAKVSNNISLKNKKEDAYNIALSIMQSDDERLLAGVNLFDGIKWFNKELTDSSLEYLFAIELLKAKKESEEDILDLYCLVEKAKIKAQYNSKLFIDKLTFKKIKAKTVTAKKDVKKTSTTKKTKI